MIWLLLRSRQDGAAAAGSRKGLLLLLAPPCCSGSPFAQQHLPFAQQTPQPRHRRWDTAAAEGGRWDNLGLRLRRDLGARRIGR